MADDPGVQTMTVIRAGQPSGVDDYGNPITGTDQQIPITGCNIQPVLRNPSLEVLAPTQDTITTKWRFFAPPGADIQAGDRVTCAIVNGQLQVDGDPVVWPDLDGTPDHVEGYLDLYTG